MKCFYEFKEWYENNLKSDNEDFCIKCFYKKLLFLEINYLLLNKRKFLVIKKNIFISRNIINVKIFNRFYASKKNYKDVEKMSKTTFLLMIKFYQGNFLIEQNSNFISVL